MTTAPDQITDQGNLNKYFHIMLNMVDDDLNPYQYRLLGHYRRRCGEHGVCYEGIRATAKTCQMSVGMVIKTRWQLVDLGYITMQEPVDDTDTYKIFIVDRMAENVARYSENSSPDEQQPVHRVNAPVHQMNTPVHGVNKRRTNIRRTQEEEQKEKNIAPSGAASLSIVEKTHTVDVEETAIATQPDTPVPVSTDEAPDTDPIISGAGGGELTYEDIRAVFRLEAELNTMMRQMLQGEAKSKTHKPYNCSPPVFANELKQWAGWWRMQNPNAHMVRSPIKVQSSIYEYREQNRATWRAIDAAIYGVVSKSKPEQPKEPEIDEETRAANRALIAAGIAEITKKTGKYKRGRTNDAA